MGKRKHGEGEAENVHEVEAIRAIRLHKGKVLYLLKWKGWPESCNTWEPRSNLVNCKAALRAFEKRQDLESHVSPSHRTSPSLDIVPSDASNVSSFQLKKGKPGFKRSVRQALAERRSKTEEKMKASLVTRPNQLEANKLCLVEVSRPSMVEAIEPVEASRPSLVQAMETNRPSLVETNRPSVVEARITTLVGGGRPSVVENSRQELAEASRLIEAMKRAQAEEMEASNNQILPGTKVKRVLKAIRYTPGPADGSKRDLRIIFKALRSDGVEVQLDNKFLRKFYPTMLLDFYEDRVKHGKVTS